MWYIIHEVKTLLKEDKLQIVEKANDHQITKLQPQSETAKSDKRKQDKKFFRHNKLKLKF